VLLQGKGHSNHETASERLMSMEQECRPAVPAEGGCQTISKQLGEPAARAGQPIGSVSGATYTNMKWWHSDMLR
jgi:hypothetical protein